MNQNFTFRLVLLLAMVALFSCKKNTDKPDYSLFVNVQLDTIINISPETAVVKGSISVKATEYHLSNYGVNYDTIKSFINQLQTTTNGCKHFYPNTNIY